MTPRDFWLTVLFGFVLGLNLLRWAIPDYDTTVARAPLWVALLMLLVLAITFITPTVVMLRVFLSGQWQNLSMSRLLVSMAVTAVYVVASSLGSSRALFQCRFRRPLTADSPSGGSLPIRSSCTGWLVSSTATG